MGVEERSETWTGSEREFRQTSSNGKTKFWKIQVSGNKITTSWGLVGGKSQEVEEVVEGVNIGKSNQKSPAQYALERSKETLRKKARDGYMEFRDGEFLDEVKELTINFDAPLPDSLCFYKPNNSLSKGMESLIENKKAIFIEKNDGLSFVLVKGSGNTKPRLYSRKMLTQHDLEVGTEFTWNTRFPRIVEDADKLMPANSIFLGELVIPGGTLQDIEQYVKSLTPRAIELSNDKHPVFIVWDIPFMDSKNLFTSIPIKQRLALIHTLVPDRKKFLAPTRFWVPGAIESVEEAVELAKKLGIEGFVVVDPDATYGTDGYNFRGKPKRPSGCEKLKPNYEDDFIVLWDPDNSIGERSTKGRYKFGIKSVELYQMNDKGELVYISNLSSGLTEEMKTELANPTKFPQVWKVEYKGRRYTSEGDDSNALDFASFCEVREDKKPDECVNPKL